ncbi:MAG: hypothetical protein ACRDA8_11250, partial [Shewanella sp.]
HNKLTASKTFNPATDRMLVDPNITFTHKLRAQQHKQAVTPKHTKQSATNTAKAKRSQYGWFHLLSDEAQLKECLASRSDSLTHLNPYLDQSEVINNAADLVITRAAAHEPKSDHFFYDQ